MATLTRRVLAEGVGSFGLTFGACGIAVLAGCHPDTAADLLCIAIGVGLAVYAMTRAVGPVSGAHLNPAISLGLAAASRFPWREVLPYGAGQLAGAVAACLALLLTAQGRPDFSLFASGFAANGFGPHSPAGYDLPSAMTVEFAITAMLVLVAASVMRRGRLIGMGPVALAVAWAAAHLLALPVTHAALNPARATGPALILRDWALAQLWLFWIAPLGGALLGGLMAFCVLDEERVRGADNGLSRLARCILGDLGQYGRLLRRVGANTATP